MKESADSDRQRRIQKTLRRLQETTERYSKVLDLIGQYVDYINSSKIDPESAEAQWKQIELLLQQQDLKTFQVLSEELSFSDASFKLGKFQGKISDS